MISKQKKVHFKIDNKKKIQKLYSDKLCLTVIKYKNEMVLFSLKNMSYIIQDMIKNHYLFVAKKEYIFLSVIDHFITDYNIMIALNERNLRDVNQRLLKEEVFNDLEISPFSETI